MNRNEKEWTDFVKCINGKTRSFKNCVGYCNCKKHKGFLDNKLFENHDCIRKKCRFLDPIIDHPCYVYAKKESERKENIKQLKKNRKNTEREIKDLANNLLPNNIEAKLCKHLYDSTYVLIIFPYVNCDEKLLKEIYSKYKVQLYIKAVKEEKELVNIEYTYLSLLPEGMRNKAREYKQNKK